MSAPTQFAGDQRHAEGSLGLRFVLLAVLCLGLMALDHRDIYLDRVRNGISVAVYPIRVLVDFPFNTWQSARQWTIDRSTLLAENERFTRERLSANFRLQRL